MLLEKIDALLVTDPDNIRYLSGFYGLAPQEREAYALVTADMTFLFVNALYSEHAKQLSKSPTLKLTHDPGRAINIIEISHDKPMSQKLKEIIKSLALPHTAKLGFEETNLTVAELSKLRSQLQEIQLISTRDRVEALRKLKHPKEIEFIRSAANLTDQCFVFILDKLKNGVTESEIAWEIETFFHSHGAEPAFSPIVAFNQNSSQPHYRPSHNSPASPAGGQLATHNQLILLDIGARVNGYCADMTRMVIVVALESEINNAYTALKSAQQKALDLFVSGERSGARLDAYVREELTKAGFPTYPHSLGHSVGLAIHEGPRLSVRRDEELKPGMVITVEPGIYLEGKFGMRIEDLVLIQEKGIEVLSTSPKNLIQL
ncbi:MAG: Xaa-Pro peptidase family protein [Patescibacteria group bacterium]